MPNILNSTTRTLGVMALSVCLLAGGCIDDPLRDNQAWLNDPSVISNPQFTPSVMPILSEIDMIDEPIEHIPGLDGPTSQDLIPSTAPYRMVAGDTVSMSVFELFHKGADTILNRRIDESGYVRLPKVGQVKAAGLSDRQLEQRLMDILVRQGLLVDPTVHVTILDGRKKVYSVIGASGSGTYQIVPTNFRLLDAMALARATITPNIKKIYIIRQVALKDLVNTGPQEPGTAPGHHRPPMRPRGKQGKIDTGSDIVSEIESIISGKTKPDNKPDANPETKGPHTHRIQDPPGLGDVLDPTQNGEGRFLNIDGRWIWVEAEELKHRTADANDASDGTLPPVEELVTQRVIEINARTLQLGDASQNIVVRPGDVIRVPIPVTGNVFIGGKGINRGGTYTLPGEKELTLRQLVISAGDLSAIGIPERVELRRRLGDNREAIVRLNLRAIAEGVQPDIYLKPNDTIDVGTNFFATPQAVIRNGFRMSYGFGFLLDRNFDDNVFGPGGN